MFDEAEILRMKAIFDGAVKHHDKWKRIPASDARLKAMAKVYRRDMNTIHFMELSRSVSNLVGDERSRFDLYLKETKGVENVHGQ